MTDQPHQQVYEQAQQPGAEVSGHGLALGLCAILAYPILKQAAEDAERKFERAELLRAYKRRHQWKASDRRNLSTFQLGQVAQRRLEGLMGRGRPVVSPHRDLATTIVEKFTIFNEAYFAEVPPAVRLRAIKRTPWWAHYVEALYRGELELARTTKAKGPSDVAERRVGRCLGISQSLVRHICGDIRARRRACFEDANFPETTVAKFENWLVHGRGEGFWEDNAACSIE